jgi:hypothetical protein
LVVSTTTVSKNTASDGGGIFYEGGPSTVSASKVSGNTSTYGGGIYDTGLGLTVSGSTLSVNSATYGGGIYGFELTVANSTFTGNSAYEGGGIYNAGATTVRDSDFGGSSTDSRNSAEFGGAISNGRVFSNGVFGTLDVRGSTFSGNTASDSGGAIYNIGTATVQACTLSSNTAGTAGGGIFNAASGSLAVKDSTVLHNVAPLGADLYNLGALTLDDSTVGVIGP